MVGVLVATHGALAQGFKSGVDMLLGPQEQFETLGLCHGDDPHAFKDQMLAAIQRLDTGDGVLTLVDILGGTPSNTAAQLMESTNIRVLAGVNLAGLINALLNRDELSLDNLATETLKVELEACADLNAKLKDPSSDSTAHDAKHDGKPTEETKPGAGELVLCRVDDRLIHGQVMTSWLNATGANKIMIVDNETAENAFLRGVFKSAVPSNVKLGVFNEAKALDRIKKGFKSTDKIIVLAKYPQTFLHLVSDGAAIDRVVIGGMGSRTDRKKFYRNISASDEEVDAFKQLIGKGVSVDIQILADDPKVSIDDLVKQPK